MSSRAVVQLNLVRRGESYDVDVPLDITPGELVQGLNEAYGLGLDTDDASQCYLKAENPIVLLHGRKSLAEFGIMNGSIINVTE